MKKVLLVDDNQDILEPLSMLLESKGYAVKVSTRGEDTYQLVGEFKPHLVVLDIFMAGIDGRDICKKIKKNDMTQKIPVIMMSAHPPAKATITSCSADAFIAKPFDAFDFLRIIKKYA